MVHKRLEPFPFKIENPLICEIKQFLNFDFFEFIEKLQNSIASFVASFF
jgi:hypothetical protein